MEVYVGHRYTYIKILQTYHKALTSCCAKKTNLTKVAKQGSKLLTFVHNAAIAVAQKPLPYVMQTKSVQEYYYYYYYFNPLGCNKAPYYVTTIV
jgi:hypothetical protein